MGQPLGLSDLSTCLLSKDSRSGSDAYSLSLCDDDDDDEDRLVCSQNSLNVDRNSLNDSNIYHQLNKFESGSSSSSSSSSSYKKPKDYHKSTSNYTKSGVDLFRRTILRERSNCLEEKQLPGDFSCNIHPSIRPESINSSSVLSYADNEKREPPDAVSKISTKCSRYNRF